jgi:hypothetical protein
MKIVRNLIGLVSGIVIAAAMGATASAAGSATLSVSPSGGNYTTGSTFTVTISENSGANDVDSARAQLNYDAGTLEIVGYNTAGNPFTTCVSPASYGGGSINTGDCTLLGGKKQGAQPLGAVTFKVLANSGASSVAFNSSSQVVNNGVDLALSFSNGSYGYSAPVQGGQGGGTGGGATDNNGGSSSNGSSSHGSSNNSSNSTATTGDGTVATTENQSAVNGDSTKNGTKSSGNKSTDGNKKNTKATKNDRTVWPWVILILLGAAAVWYGLRSRKEAPAENPEVVTDAKAKATNKADKPASKDVKTAEKAAVAAPQKTAAKKPAQTRKKSGKKSGKKSR